MMRKTRSGFTLLELLIALGLLGGLLAVAWSILGTIRDAEVRADGLSQRLRARHSVRHWIEDDLQHLIARTSADKDSQVHFRARDDRQLAFRGDSQGFTASLRPSLDPLDLLQQVVSRAASNSNSRVLELPNPEQTIRVEYRAIEAEPTLEIGPNSTGLRRVLFPELPTSAEREGRGSQSERVLTGTDLYRRGTALDDNRRTNPGSTASIIPGLRRMQFRYSDGRQWRTSWDSAVQQSLPRAVELCFDLERRSTASAVRSLPSVGATPRLSTDPIVVASAGYDATVGGDEATGSGKDALSHEHCLVWLIEAGGGQR